MFGNAENAENRGEGENGKIIIFCFRFPGFVARHARGFVYTQERHIGAIGQGETNIA
jgi:hypothetical protein